MILLGVTTDHWGATRRLTLSPHPATGDAIPYGSRHPNGSDWQWTDTRKQPSAQNPRSVLYHSRRNLQKGSVSLEEGTAWPDGWT